jgi:hypothetical protein
MTHGPGDPHALARKELVVVAYLRGAPATKDTIRARELARETTLTHTEAGAALARLEATSVVGAVMKTTSRSARWEVVNGD